MALAWRERWARSDDAVPHAPVPPPPHPTFDLRQLIQAALLEDSAGVGDITTDATVDAETQAVGTFLAKADGVLAGLAVADEVFREVDPSLQVAWTACDGAAVAAGTVFGTVTGSARSLLIAERIALNLLQRMGGIATATAAMVAAVQGTGAEILETRKTAPGLRLLDKWAVLIGGGSNHRMGLFDMLMVKDNHVTAAGGIAPAVARCQAHLAAKGLDVPFEVETRTLAEVRELLGLLEAGKAAGVTRVMLDNMVQRGPGGTDVSMLAEAVRLIGRRLETEASGNVTLETVRDIAQTGVNFVSCGALTHSVAALDISLKIALRL